MIRQRWWPLGGTKIGIKKPRRRGERVREVFLGPEIVLSGELKSCGTLVAEGIVDGSRIECREFILGSTGSCKGEVQAESAVISGRFEGRLIVRSRLLIKSGGQVRGSVQYGQVEIEPGGELQGDMVVHPASNPVPQDELDILDIPTKRNLARSIGKTVSLPHKLPLSVPNGIDERAIEANSR
jgi:cytoskeletal protein CcmA (bactofilin family)